MKKDNETLNSYVEGYKAGIHHYKSSQEFFEQKEELYAYFKKWIRELAELINDDYKNFLINLKNGCEADLHWNRMWHYVGELCAHLDAIEVSVWRRWR